MSTQAKLDKILGIIRYIMNDDKKLTKVLEFLEQEILDDEPDTDDSENHLEQVPEKYRKIISEIADNMEANLISYFNPDTLEIEFYPKDALIMEDYEDEDWEDPELKWDNCITIEPLESRESFQLMENFVNQLKDKKVASRLSQALNGVKPFANFNCIIHDSKFREDWFAFRQKELEKYVINNYFYDF
jgi:hypothetical protein